MSKNPGHISLNGSEYIVADNTYNKQLQTTFTPRFSTGDQNYGDLSFFQFLAQEDFSGGNGQEIFTINNRFNESEGIDTSVPEEAKLSPKVEFITEINGPEHEHLNDPTALEDAWPQIIEWLGRAVIYNDRIEFDSGELEFLEVFETDIIRDQSINTDTSGTAGNHVDDTRAEIIDITKTSGLPGDVFSVTVKFKTLKLEIMRGNHLPPTATPQHTDQLFRVEFRLDFGGEGARQSEAFTTETQVFEHALFSFVNPGRDYINTATLNQDITVVFSVRVPSGEDFSPGIYKLWTSVSWEGLPFSINQSGPSGQFWKNLLANMSLTDPESKAQVLFFVESVTDVIVERQNLYVPQLKAATVSGDKLIGVRVFDGAGYLEVYQEQNEAIDRTLQISFSEAGITPIAPTYAELISRRNIVIMAIDNKLFAVDIETSGLTDAQRVTSIGQISGDYASGMALWNQRIYIGSFDKSLYVSSIVWTDGTEIIGSYDIDGKFWLRDMANFQGALFYCGGTQDGKGEIRAFPNEVLADVEHPVFDSHVRSLNAGRKLYAGRSHATGLMTVTERGISSWAKTELEDSPLNIVWDIEEVGTNVYFLANQSIFKTTNRFTLNGFIETSKYGGNTPLIDKTWDSVAIEAELQAAHTLRILATNSTRQAGEWVLLGEMTAADPAEKTFFFPPEFTSQWAQVRIEFITTDDTSSPILKRVMTKYVPSSLQKLQWGFAIRADNQARLLNRSKDNRSGSDILAQLFGLRALGKVRFRDVDNNEFDVILSDIKQSSPIIKGEDLEGIVTVELLET